MKARFGQVAFLLLAPCAVIAQEPASDMSRSDVDLAEKAADENSPIVVTGKVDKRVVIAGSRLPRTPLVADGPVATNTGTRGLVPQSGMDPFAGRTKLTITKSCQSDDPAIGSRAACILVEADAFESAGAGDAAADLLSSLSADTTFEPIERLSAAKRIYRLGTESGRSDLRRSGLLLMIETGALPREEKVSALRALLSMAVKEDRQSDAVALLRQILTIDAGGAQDWANLAIMTRENDLDASRTYMRKAIDLRETDKRPVDDSWRRFAQD